MLRGRIDSSVSDSFGNRAIYTSEPPPEEPAIVNASNHILPSTMSRISAEVQELRITEPVTLVPMEGLPFLMSSLFVTNLEDVMAQISCLEKCNNELSISKTLSDLDHLKGIKFGALNAADFKDELAGVDPHNLENLIYKIKKLDRDRKYVSNVIVSTYMDLVRCFTFHPLIRFIQEIQNLERYRLELEEEEGKNRILRRELSKQARQQRNHIKSVIYDTDVTIDKLRAQVEDSVLFSEVRGRYIDNWQQARTEQHSQSIFNKENDPISKIDYYKRRSEHEQRIHSEVELLVDIAINETLTKIEEWMDKYDSDIEKIDHRIQIQKNNYQDTRDKRIGLEETLAKHDIQMKEWTYFKGEREKARAYRELMTTSAIIVQAWWRGLLVRLQLGPFKVKQNKKELKKKKK